MKVGIITHSVSAAERVLQWESAFDAVEIRVDTFEKEVIASVQAIQKLTSKPIILTLRSEGHGGFYSGDPYFLIELAHLLPAFLDVEYDIPDDVIRLIPSEIHCISSYHNFIETPSNLDDIVVKVQSRISARYKIACMPKTAGDTLRLLQLGMKHENLTVIAMGKDGAFSRIIAPIFGDVLQFIAVAGRSAPGQFTYNELVHVYNYLRISPRTRVYALIGDPVDKSLSHISHNAVFSELQIDAVYVKIRVAEKDASSFFHNTLLLPFYGFSITMPLKRHFSFNPVNTARRANGHWATKNTDGIGALRAIERKVCCRGKTMLILGAGGASHAIALEAIKRGAVVKIANRSIENAHALRELLGPSCSAGSITDQTFCNNYDILVNCTPVGMFEAKSPIPLPWLLPGSIVMDCISNPQKTPLIQHAEKMECLVVFGIEMFILQAVEQFLFWFPDIKHEEQRIERIMRTSLATPQEYGE